MQLLDDAFGYTPAGVISVEMVNVSGQSINLPVLNRPGCVAPLSLVPVVGHQVTVGIETKFACAKSGDGMPFRWTDDPNAPAVTVKEEEIYKQFPLDFSTMVRRLRGRYTDFKSDQRFNDIKRRLEGVGKPFCIERFLDPIRKSPTRKRLYSPEVFKEFDKHYTRKTAEKQTS